MTHRRLHASGLALLLAFGLPALADEGHGHPAAHWAYGGESGPESWGSLESDYAVCGAGTQQSPIDIPSRAAVQAEVAAIEFDYKDAPLKIVNNGHTVQVNYAPGSAIRIGGERYELLQFHFHTPSEHTVDSGAAAMELHLVHRNQAGELAVVGVMMDRGPAPDALQKVWDGIPTELNHEHSPGGSINAAALLPADTSRFYHYQGSLTTPPCSETVHWYVLKDRVTVSEEQLARFTSLIGKNARPVQPLHRRFVLEAI